jgi:hypothetical protein
MEFGLVFLVLILYNKFGRLRKIVVSYLRLTGIGEVYFETLA